MTKDEADGSADKTKVFPEGWPTHWGETALDRLGIRVFGTPLQSVRLTHEAFGLIGRGSTIQEAYEDLARKVAEYTSPRVFPVGWPARWSVTTLMDLGIEYEELDSGQIRVEHTDTKRTGHGSTLQEAYEDLARKVVRYLDRASTPKEPSELRRAIGELRSMIGDVPWPDGHRDQLPEESLRLRPEDDDKPYTIWLDYGTEGWSPSEPQASLDACFVYMHGLGFTGEFRITREVHYEIKEVP